MQPVIINSTGNLQLSHGAIRVGTAVQPYHAVPLGQVRRMLSEIAVTGTGGVFTVYDNFELLDSVIAFCLSEPGFQEKLDYVYVGRVIEDTKSMTDKIIDPPVEQTICEVITAVDVFSPYALSDPNYVIDLGFGSVFTGILDEDEATFDDAALAVMPEPAIEVITLNEKSFSYTISESGWCDSNLDYVYTGIGTGEVTVEDTFIATSTTIATDTITLSDTNESDVVFITLPEEEEAYPDGGMVLQKIKPMPTETKTLGDAVIIPQESKATDSCALKDAAFGYCLSEAWVAEPFTRLQYAQVRETVTASQTTANGVLELFNIN
jgi:hypothetical protein